ncbi:hypothetical protein CFP65_0044 [Kitasatospora sp. MMS16-BH015]|uniref:hypothetical protein n=1 Tax=Kitasatospora sp. MMS16-BH015 TaxID=2018025 RepID=UPI000CA26357|nr:hypothetical protein [Kitasatospora sp. MMS16-BH015]AUG75030.1 hypothetical protein CFP65_0044 [Kitasatospora sp. MMS16-BH015]
MKFIQIIEYRTRRIDEFNELLDGWVEQNAGHRLASWALQTRDRDGEDVYLNIVQFPSYEQAMANSDRPETAEFATRAAALCDGPPKFRNLDVLNVRDFRS